MVDLPFPEAQHACRAIHLVPDHARRALALRPVELAQPDRKSVHQASRERLEAARVPSLVAGAEGRPAVELVEVGADVRGFLEPHTVVADEIGNAAGWIDLV